MRDRNIYFATKCFSLSWAIPTVVELDLWYLILVHFAGGGRISRQILKHVYQDERLQYLFCHQMFFFFLSNTDCSRIGFVIYYPCTFCEWRRDILPGLEACVPGWATAITFFVLFCHQMFFAFLSNIDCSRIGFVISYPPTFCDWRRDILTDLEAYVPGWETAIVFVLFCRQMFFAFLSNTDCSNIWFVICYLGTFCEWRRDILPDLEACVPGWATAIIFFVLLCHQMFSLSWAIPTVVKFDL